MNPRHHPAANPAPGLDAWARRAAAANGFCAADTALAPLPAPDADRDRVAHSRHAYRLAEVLVELGAALVDAVRRAWQRWQRRHAAFAHRRAPRRVAL